MYTKILMERFQNPRNAGGMHGANAIGQVENSICSDIMKIYLKINDNTGIIENARFKTFGCCASIACTDVICDLVKEKSIEDALKVTNQDIINFLGGIPGNKIHCSLMAEDAVRAAVADYYKKKEKETKAAIKKSEKQSLINDSEVSLDEDIED